MPRNLRKAVLAGAFVLTLSLAGAAAAQIVTSDVNFPKGATSTTISGTIAGDQIRDYVVRAGEGQVMRVNLSGASIVYFNVLAPGSNDEAIFTGSVEGKSFAGTLSASGPYKIRVYQMRASARRGEKGAYKLAVSVTGTPPKTGHAGHAGHGFEGIGGGLAGLAGMDSVEAIDAMSARGFADVDSLTSGNTQYGIFYNRSTRTCAQLTMADGKVVDARDIHTHPKCR